jgi:hypothetical protein
MIIVLFFEGRIKIGKMCIISTTKKQNQTNVDAKEEFEGSKGCWVCQILHEASFHIISQLIRYSSAACGSFQDVLDKGFLLTRKLLNHWFLLVKVMSSRPSFLSVVRLYVGLPREVNSHHG